MIQRLLRMIPIAVLVVAIFALWDEHGWSARLYGFGLALLAALAVGFISAKLPKGL